MPRRRGRTGFSLAGAALGALVLVVLLGCQSLPTSRISQQLCAPSRALGAADQDRMLRFAAVIRHELERSGESIALISRTGIDLERFDLRFSHAGVVLRNNPVPWSVRQLYFACEDGYPRLFDQGISGFVFNSDEPGIAHVSIVLLPPQQARQLEHTARDNQRALRLLSLRYSANAYPFSTRYQNCNQWVAELLAAAWGELPDSENLREQAQQWLKQAGYAPQPLVLDSHPMKFIAQFFPLLKLDDHPDEERFGMRMTLSLPESIEDFVRAKVAQARRIEICHDQDRIVVRQGWEPIAKGCRPQSGDRVIAIRDVGSQQLGVGT